MRIGKLDHIGIATRDSSAAETFYHGALGLPVESREDLESMKLRIVKIRLDGVVLELLEPLAGEDVVSRFLSSRGEGIHHLCFQVGNLTAALRELQARGYQAVWDVPRRGSGGAWVSFLRPKQTGGVLIELTEPAVSSPG